MRLLLGGVPLGCDNVGDEAIVACVVALLKRLLINVELTVCTRELEKTATALQVRAVPLYGFEPDPDLEGFVREVRQHDAYIWFGATGLSDYPETALRLLEAAQAAGVRTIVWGVGMNAQLNPVFYKAAGTRRKLLRMATFCCLGLVDWTRAYENFLVRRTRRHIGKTLSRCALVVLRDAESTDEVARCGVKNVLMGADTATLLQSAAKPPLPEAPDITRIGFCLSAQSVVKQLDRMRLFWDSLLERPNLRLVLIPMNPKTDRKLMRGLAAQTRHPERIECLEDDTPEVVQACAAQCRAVVSSRLHLLILASNAGVPAIGIERGSKITNWLKQFGRSPAGTVEACDFDALQAQLDEALATPPEEAAAAIRQVMDTLHQRLETAAEILKNTLTGQAT